MLQDVFYQVASNVASHQNSNAYAKIIIHDELSEKLDTYANYVLKLNYGIEKNKFMNAISETF